MLYLNVVSLLRIVDEDLRPSKIQFDESDLQDLTSTLTKMQCELVAQHAFTDFLLPPTHHNYPTTHQLDKQSLAIFRAHVRRASHSCCSEEGSIDLEFLAVGLRRNFQVFGNFGLVRGMIFSTLDVFMD